MAGFRVREWDPVRYGREMFRRVMNALEEDREEKARLATGEITVMDYLLAKKESPADLAVIQSRGSHSQPRASLRPLELPAHLRFTSQERRSLRATELDDQSS